MSFAGPEAVSNSPRLALLVLASCGIGGACYLMRNYFFHPVKP